ncbi:MAG TPA: 3-hydroxyacyl-CoA dehydrogenase NAD-binding domain-containing protein [Phycisphaerales bacterium]|nr:3-hydroxyacyl-CoA dehydrogenase NAD-binding domain-containing protein [Phycisphaerales bacterium]
MQDIRSVGVIGAGQMGSGIAQVAAVAGLGVALYDAAPGAVAKAREGHAKRLAREVEKQRLAKADSEAALARIRPAESLDALAACDIVIEAIVEDAGVKRELFARLARLFPAERAGPAGPVILASNTSSISITEIAGAVGPAGAPERVIGMHFFNPVPVMKLVEVIRGLATSEATTARVVALARAMGKTPVPANDRPGFVSNRVLMPMINEAFFAWMEGVAEPEHIDEIMKLGCNFPMGPLRLADFIGLDTCLHILGVLHRELGDPKYRPCPLLRQLVAAGRLGDKAGRGVFAYPGS